MSFLEIFACILFLICFCILMIFAFIDMVKIWQARKNEDLRLETIKNTLQDISTALGEISKGIWYEK